MREDERRFGRDTPGCRKLIRQMEEVRLMDEIDRAETLYQITLNDRQRYLLTMPEPRTPREEQARYLLRIALQPIPCPVCKGMLCQVSASTKGYDPESSEVHGDNSYACPFCGAKLHYYLLLFGGGHGFDLQPGQRVVGTEETK